MTDPLRHSPIEEVSTWLSRVGISIEKNRLSTYRWAFQAVDPQKSIGAFDQGKKKLSCGELANVFHEFGEIYQVWRGNVSVLLTTLPPPPAV